jgi:Superfamily I DNA and RNA helicases
MSGVKPLSNLEKQFFRDYQNELRKNCLIDFDDILMLTHKLFSEHPEILQACCERFTAILVDEFQDTDRIQYEILKMLAEGHRNIFAVADDDQSIFSWRGAHPENVHNFRGDFAGENVIQLDNNYRSSEEIVAQAGSLIVKNNRLAIKNLSATLGPGLPVRFVHFQNETDEADF